MEVKRLITGGLSTNTYFIIDNKDCIIVDPAGDGKDIKGFIESHNLHPLCIINTHGHIDHIESNDVIKGYFSIPVIAHPYSKDIFPYPDKNLSIFMGKEVKVSPPDISVSEGERINIGDEFIEILYTPGHSIDSISLYFEGKIICGDVLFVDSIGRTDLPGGDTEILYNTIKEKILSFPNDTTVFPGHGEWATIDFILSVNAFL